MPTPAVGGGIGSGRYSQYSCELLAQDCTAPARASVCARDKTTNIHRRIIDDNLIHSIPRVAKGWSSTQLACFLAGGPTLKSYRHEAKKWVGGLEANFHKRSLCVKIIHNTCTAL